MAIEELQRASIQGPPNLRTSRGCSGPGCGTGRCALGSFVPELRRASGEVRISVTDDGCRGAVLRPGSGLAGPTDRVSAIGGTLHVASPAGRGTRVEALLPFAS